MNNHEKQDSNSADSPEFAKSKLEKVFVGNSFFAFDAYSNVLLGIFPGQLNELRSLRARKNVLKQKHARLTSINKTLVQREIRTHYHRLATRKTSQKKFTSTTFWRRVRWIPFKNSRNIMPLNKLNLVTKINTEAKRCFATHDEDNDYFNMRIYIILIACVYIKQFNFIQ